MPHSAIQHHATSYFQALNLAIEISGLQSSLRTGLSSRGAFTFGASWHLYLA